MSNPKPTTTALPAGVPLLEQHKHFGEKAVTVYAIKLQR